MGKGKQLREMMSRGLVVAPFCYDCYHARIAQLVGFEAVYMTGHGVSAARGFCDFGLITQTEQVQAARYIVNAVDIPVICDADSGYGNILNVWRTVREFEAAGAAAIHMEDQTLSKKCGFFEGKVVIPMEEHVQKIRAAADARRDKDFVIIARCDALALNGWEDTIKRCNAYHEAGADVVFVDGIFTREELEIYAREMRNLPKLFNGGSRFPAPTQEVAKMGFKIMIASSTFAVANNAVKRAFEELKEKGMVSDELIGDFGSPDLHTLMGQSLFYEMEKRYAVNDPKPEH